MFIVISCDFSKLFDSVLHFSLVTKIAELPIMTLYIIGLETSCVQISLYELGLQFSVLQL